MAMSSSSLIVLAQTVSAVLFVEFIAEVKSFPLSLLYTLR